MGKPRTTRLVAALAALAVATLLVATGCSSRHGFDGSDDCDYLILPEIADGGIVPISTLVCDPDYVPIDFTLRAVFRGPTESEGGLGEPPDGTDLSQFQVEHYDVTFRNLTSGGTVAGVDVPAPFRQTVAAIFDMTEEEELELTDFPIMLGGAKASPPLNQDSFYPSDAGVALEATITFWGHPVTNDDAWCFATMRWIFTVVPC